MSSVMKSINRPSRCNKASICTARSDDSGAATGVSGSGPNSKAGAGRDDSGTSSGAISYGISPLPRTEKKHRKAYDKRFPNPIISAPLDMGKQASSLANPIIEGLGRAELIPYTMNPYATGHQRLSQW